METEWDLRKGYSTLSPTFPFIFFLCTYFFSFSYIKSASQYSLYQTFNLALLFHFYFFCSRTLYIFYRSTVLVLCMYYIYIHIFFFIINNRYTLLLDFILNNYRYFIYPIGILFCSLIFIIVL